MKKISKIISIALLFTGVFFNPANADDNYEAAQIASVSRNLVLDQLQPAVNAARLEYKKTWDADFTNQKHEPNSAASQAEQKWLTLQSSMIAQSNAAFNQAYNAALQTLQVTSAPTVTSEPTVTSAPTTVKTVIQIKIEQLLIRIYALLNRLSLSN